MRNFFKKSVNNQLVDTSYLLAKGCDYFTPLDMFCAEVQQSFFKNLKGGSLHVAKIDPVHYIYETDDGITVEIKEER